MERSFWEKGNISNLLSLALLGLGLVAEAERWPLSSWILAAGLFGFAGGITNWLAVKMLFDRVPLLYGSGVIPARFREIRQTVKDLIMAHFFDEGHLRRFFGEHLELFTLRQDLEAGLKALLDSEEADRAIGRKLEELKASPIGMMLKLAGPDFLRVMVKQFLAGLAAELGPQLAARFTRAPLDVHGLREQVDRLLAAKLEELTPERVKQMMEEVIRQHLGWLVVWGNVFGGLIGVVSRALGY